MSKNKCDVKAADNNLETALHFAARFPAIAIVRYLVLSGKIAVDVKDRQGKTPLHVAAEEGNLELVKCLVEELKPM